MLSGTTTAEGNTDVVAGPTTHQHRASSRTRASDELSTPSDCGHTLVELMILGVLGSVVWLGVTGMTTEAADTGCRADRNQLHVSAEAFFAQTGRDHNPATGSEHDRYERTFVDDGFLTRISTYHDLTANGALTQEHPSC